MTAFAPTLVRSLFVAALLATASPIATAEAAGPNRVLAREPLPAKSDSCRPRWPYIVPLCVA